MALWTAANCESAAHLESLLSYILHSLPVTKPLCIEGCPGSKGIKMFKAVAIFCQFEYEKVVYSGRLSFPKTLSLCVVWNPWCSILGTIPLMFSCVRGCVIILNFESLLVEFYPMRHSLTLSVYSFAFTFVSCSWLLTNLEPLNTIFSVWTSSTMLEMPK